MKKGSALLIVLGMVAFMTVSAVGFSMFMRTSRAPSGYLRRNIAARYIVKAALAKAIGELEGDFNTVQNWGPQKFYGIHDDPFPGIVMDSTERSSANGSLNGDYWYGRVFMPFGSVDWDKTVSTLTLEALAYLPPALIDDVRNLSRRTRTAIWRQLPYSSGRYAYCAVNVSDLFDINRLRANVARDSGMNRITLATLCMNAGGSINTGTAGTLDTVLDKVDTVGVLENPVPFVSLADFNLVAGAGSPWAPFMDAIGKGSGAMLKPGDMDHGNALFVTDTWFPPTNTTAAVFDLASNAQPFNNEWNAQSFLEVENKMNGTSVGGVSAKDLYVKNLGVGISCLYDYLDSDSKPISLALPTTEAVPMVVGIGVPVGLQPNFGEIGSAIDAGISGISGYIYGDAPDAETPPPRKKSDYIQAKRKLQLFGLTSFGSRVNVQVVVANPFKRLSATSRAKSFSVRGLMRVWLAPADMGCRPGDENMHPAKALWEDGKLKSGGLSHNGVATFLSDSQTLSFSDPATSRDAVKNVNLSFSNLDVEMPLWYNVTESDPNSSADPEAAVYKYVDESSIKGKTFNEGPYKSLGDLKDKKNGDAITALCPLTKDGAVDGDWRTKADNSKFDTAKPYAPGDDAGVTVFDPASLTAGYRLYAALWIQVLDGNNKVVDMAPACLADDNEWLDAGLPDNNAMFRTCGDISPVLDFMSSADIKYETIETALAQQPSFDQYKALYAVDPRYNFAPEDWFSRPEEPSENTWLDLITPILGKNGRDHDIYMFVSDQEYLQSIGELQFLPNLADMDGTASAPPATTYAPDFHGGRLSANTGPTSGNFANGERFWKTYSAYSVGGEGTSLRNPYYLKDGGNEVTVQSGASGFKINPFSQDDRVLDAALVCTPFDWYVASTNSSQAQDGGQKNNLVGDNMTLDKMVSSYSFGENNALAKITREEFGAIADEIKDSFADAAENGDRDWLGAWDDLAWQDSGTGDDNKTFLGATLSEPLHGVDRKFLYSFWRECFANRQQLFLIFVRAEPTGVGGGGASGLGSQLGGRAVALVWRDPEPQEGMSGRSARSAFSTIQNFLDLRGDTQHPPHRTRVLFYHQFD